MLLETQRLLLRELEESDFAALCRTLQDRDAMYAYEHAFSNEEVHQWLARQMRRYREDGFGLWAVILKGTDDFIGQCGLTKQPVDNTQVTEIGYLLQRDHWHNGYATEGALACKDYAFSVLGEQERRGLRIAVLYPQCKLLVAWAEIITAIHAHGRSSRARRALAWA